jgi:DinB family protein
MDVGDVLTELYGRIPPLAHTAVTGLDAEQLRRLPVEGANSIGWLVWHLARVEDHQMADMFELEQVWVNSACASEVGLDPDPSNIGYGHTRDDAAAVQPQDPGVLIDYLDAVHRRTINLVGGVTAVDLDRIIDANWDPPVTMGVRLVSIADDCLQHVGQANYLRGMFGW